MFGRPLVPIFLLTIFFHERTEENVIVEPGALLLAELSEVQSSVFARAIAKSAKSLFQQMPIQCLDARIFDRPSTKIGKIDLGKRGIKIFQR